MLSQFQGSRPYITAPAVPALAGADVCVRLAPYMIIASDIGELRLCRAPGRGRCYGADRLRRPLSGTSPSPALECQATVVEKVDTPDLKFGANMSSNLISGRKPAAVCSLIWWSAVLIRLRILVQSQSYRSPPCLLTSENQVTDVITP